MDEQQRVVEFVAAHELEAPPEFRVLDLVSEVGEVAKDAAESTAYGSSPATLSVESDEIGDVLFSLLALSNALEIDAGEALDEALAKYENRMANRGDPSSGT